MCGIAGLVAATLSVGELRSRVEQMNEVLWHRGPDDSGLTSAEGVALAMRRLAIVDVEHGKQPMLSEDEGTALVFNGEIYNAPALRTLLQGEGVQFRTRSDTEVILRLYLRDPGDLERRLAGMWAYAIHDRRRRKLVLSRDRFGIKPLFYAHVGQTIAFGSELKSLRTLRDTTAFGGLFKVDHAAAHAMLSWGYVPDQDTIFRGISRVEPGTRVEFDLEGGNSRSERYWSLTPSLAASTVRTMDEACEMVEPVLARATREHLESDVPIGAFMSGGIDSSLVTSFAARASKQRVSAFTVGFENPRFDESARARELAERIGVDLHIALLTERAALDGLADTVLAYDEPFGDSSGLAVYLVSRHASRTHKVVLGGDGGDEVFAGYRKHQIIGARDALKHTPALRDALARAIQHIPARTDRTLWWTDMLRTVRRVSRGLEGSDARAWVSLTSIASLEKTAPLMASSDDPERFERRKIERFERTVGTALQRTLASDLGSPLANDMLTKVDRASMACHLEVRVPFMDHHVVEVGLGLPQKFTLGGGGKGVLRALHAKTIGGRLNAAPKRGFGVPVETWLRGALAPACDELFSRDRLARYGVLSARELSDGGWRAWAHTDPQILWNAFMLAAWCEWFLGDGANAVRQLFDRVLGK